MEPNVDYEVTGHQTASDPGQIAYIMRVPNKILSELLSCPDNYELALQFNSCTSSGDSGVLSGSIADVNDSQSCLCQIKELITADVKEVYRVQDSGTVSQLHLIENSASKLVVTAAAGRSKRSLEVATEGISPGPKRSAVVSAIDIALLPPEPGSLSSGSSNKIANKIAVSSTAASRKPKARRENHSVSVDSAPAASVSSGGAISTQPTLRSFEGVCWVAIEGLHSDVGLDNLKALFAGLKWDESGIMCGVNDSLFDVSAGSSSGGACPVLLNLYVPLASMTDLSVALSRHQDVLPLSPGQFAAKSVGGARSKRARTTSTLDSFANCHVDASLRQVSLEEWFFLEHVAIPWSALTAVADSRGQRTSDILADLGVKLKNLHDFVSGSPAGQFGLSSLVNKHGPFLRSIQSKTRNRYIIGGTPGSLLRPYMVLNVTVNAVAVASCCVGTTTCTAPGAAGTSSSGVSTAIAVGEDIYTDLCRFISRLELFAHDLLLRLDAGGEGADIDMLLLDCCSKLLLCHRFMFDQYYKHYY